MTFCRKTVEETCHEVKITGEMQLLFCGLLLYSTTEYTENRIICRLCIKFSRLKWADFFRIVIKDAEIQQIIKNNRNNKL